MAKGKKSVKKNPVKGKAMRSAKKKAVKKRPASKKPVAKDEEKPTIKGLDRKVELLEGEVARARSDFLDNELSLKRKIAEKNKAEAQLAALLRKKFSAEKRALARIKESTSIKRANLKRKISSLQRINNIYGEKKAKIENAKKRYNALKRQLDLLEKKAGELTVYA
jgi:chromosome segregation ATPase